jgi:hypothetical protein
MGIKPTSEQVHMKICEFITLYSLQISYMFRSSFVAISAGIFTKNILQIQTEYQLKNIKVWICDSQYILKYKIQVELFVLNLRE